MILEPGIQQHPLAWWQANNPLLSNGQIGQIIDQGTYKVGDGFNLFNALPFMGQPTGNVWYSIFYLIENDAAKLCTAYSPPLLGGTFVQEADWVEFAFTVKPASNGNAKTIYVKFANNTLLTISVATSNANPILIAGKIKCTGYTSGKCYYEITWRSYDTLGGLSEVITTGNLTGFNWSINNNLLLQIEGQISGDLIANGGEGKLFIISRM